MIELSSDVLIQVLGAASGDLPSVPGEAVAVVRRYEPSFAPTLFSAWEREGRELSPPLRHEVDQQRERMAFFEGLHRRLGAVGGGAVLLKGLEVAACYPDGLLRYMNDLDYWAEEATVWRLARALLSEGWELHSATFGRIDGDLHVLVSLRHGARDPYALPYGLEIATYALTGNQAGVPSRRDLPAGCTSGPAKNLLALLYERFEQRWRARDLVDAALQLERLDEAGAAALQVAMERLHLAPELIELAERTAATPLPPIPVPAGLRGRAAADRVLRLAAGAARYRDPLGAAMRNLQGRVVRGRATPLEARAWALAQGRLATRRALDSGLFVFGLPVGEPVERASHAVLRQTPRALWADTPVGSFALVAGDEIDEEALEEVDR